jgi:hypothetical protein
MLDKLQIRKADVTMPSLPRARQSILREQSRRQECPVSQTDDYRFRRLLIAFMTVMLLALPDLATSGQQKSLSGYIERVRIHPGGIELHARIDTGAGHSSLDARDIERFTRDTKPWLRFSVTNQLKRIVVIERPLHRIARIRRHGGRIQEREVVLLSICLGAILKTAEVNLIDRAGFDYPMLIGRSFLGEDFLVNPGERFLLEPSCGKVPQ